MMLKASDCEMNVLVANNNVSRCYRMRPTMNLNSAPRIKGFAAKVTLEIACIL